MEGAPVPRIVSRADIPRHSHTRPTFEIALGARGQSEKVAHPYSAGVDCAAEPLRFPLDRPPASTFSFWLSHTIGIHVKTWKSSQPCPSRDKQCAYLRLFHDYFTIISWLFTIKMKIPLRFDTPTLAADQTRRTIFPVSHKNSIKKRWFGALKEA